MLLEDEAYVLFSRPQGETSAWLSVLTKQYGRLQLTYKGGQKKISTCPSFQALTLSWRLGKSGGSSGWLASCEHLGYVAPLLGMSNWSGLYVNELLHRGVLADTAIPGLFDAYQQLVMALRRTQDHRASMAWALRRFEWQYLLLMGYGLPMVTVYHQPIMHDGYYQWQQEGWVQCEQGIGGAELMALADQAESGVASGALRTLLQWRLLQAMPRQALSMRQWWEQLQ